MQALKKYFQGDRVIWLILLVLAMFSVLAVYSASGMLAYKFQAGNTTYYLVKHIALLAMAFVVVFATHKIPYNYFSKLSELLFYLAIILLFLTFLIGANLNDASRWLTLPGGLSFQTSDFAKIVLVTYMARIFAKRKDKVHNFKDALRIFMFPVLIVCGLIFPADFSTAILLFSTIVVMMFVARLKFKYIFGMIGVAMGAAALFVLIAMAMPDSGRVDTWKSRIESFTSGDAESNFQADHSRIAIASGGIIPNGPGKSVQRNILPHPYSDFIYAIIVEEYGILLGGILIPLLYLILFNRSLKIVRKCPGSFSALMVAGLTILLVMQAFVNMMVAVNLLPVTGQTLPFVSMGGTSMIFIGIAFGLILSVSRTVQEAELQHELNPQATQQKEEFNNEI
ncbi:MAG: FtsW/RodA/SpoVE family cell cycle protein [Bacteroidales bacterium]